MEELKSCPFCGGIAETVRDVEHQSDAVFVRCTKCGVRTKSVVYNARKHPHGEEYEEAWSLWNRRAAQGNKPLTLEELRQMDGEPVWCVDGTGEKAWCLLDVDSDGCPNAIDKDSELWDGIFYNMREVTGPNPDKLHVLGWLAYAHKPGKEKWSYKDILKQEG